MGCQPLSALFVSCSFFPIHSIFLLSKFSKLVDNSFPRIELYLNIHSICILQTTAIRHHLHQTQTPHLDWSSLSRLRFVNIYSPSASLLVVSSSRRLLSSIRPRPSSAPWCSVIVTLRNPITVVVPVVLFLGLGVSLSVSYYLSYPLLYCARVLVVLLSLFWICMYCWRTNKNSYNHNISQPTSQSSLSYKSTPLHE